jgi:methyl-accepting chemotaxis protein
MGTRVATALASGNVGDASEKLLEEVERRLEGAEVKLCLVFGSTEQPLGTLARLISARLPRAVVLGASTAGEFTQVGDAKGSVAMFALSGDYKIFCGMGNGLKADAVKAVEQALEGLPRELHGYPYRTALMLLDPLAGRGEEATLIAATLLGDDIRLAGGAAGDDLKMARTLVSCGPRAESDAVAIALIFSKAPLGVGVCHGHEPLSKPLRVTKAEAGTVIEVEGRPAWEVWKEQTRERAAERGIDVAQLSREDEGGFLLRYEAGLSAGDGYKIRAPLSRNADGSINFACGIPEGAVIRITESEPERQLESAREAARRARAQLEGASVAGALVFDCICRNLILGADFARAVRGISDELGNVPLAGFETYGEIALDAGDMSGFHNTTSVVLVFPEA